MTQVFGPYKDRDKWRLIVLAGGKRKSIIAGSLEEAERLKLQLGQAIIERMLGGKVLGDSAP